MLVYYENIKDFLTIFSVKQKESDLICFLKHFEKRN